MKNHNYGKFIATLFLILALLSFLCISICGNTEDVTRVIIQWTAKFSTVLFIIAFGASSFHNIFKDNVSALALKYRAYFGLAFGTAHTAHLISLFYLQYFFHPVFVLADKTSLLGGGMAYVLMYAMMVTTFPYFRPARSGGRNKMSPKNWRRLHLIGGYWILILFIRTYIKRVTVEGYGYGLLGLLVIVLILRVISFFQKSRKAFG